MMIIIMMMMTMMMMTMMMMTMMMMNIHTYIPACRASVVQTSPCPLVPLCVGPYHISEQSKNTHGDNEGKQTTLIRRHPLLNQLGVYSTCGFGCVTLIIIIMY